MDFSNENNVKREFFYKLQKQRKSKVRYANYIKDCERIAELYNKISFIKHRMLLRYGDFQNYISEAQSGASQSGASLASLDPKGRGSGGLWPQRELNAIIPEKQVSQEK